jgi:uncharacterized protein with NAD-binding domain and iron-sulfur cluster
VTRSKHQLPHHPRKIAILGGGIGSLVTAFELTSQPNWRDHYEITIYQQGHKLGGKGASVRTRDNGMERVEEHGLHVFFGFYENAFQIMRRVYGELDEVRRCEEARGEAREARGLTMETAFEPHDLILMGAKHRGEIKSWPMPFPRRAGEPGTRTTPPEGLDDDDSILDGGTILTGLLELSSAYLSQLSGALTSDGGLGSDGYVDRLGRNLDEAGQDGELVTSVMKAVNKVLRLLPRSVFVDGVPRLERLLKGPLKRFGDGSNLRHPLLRKLLATQLALLRRQLMAATAPFTRDYRIVQLRAGVDLQLTLAIGLLQDDLLHQGVDWYKLDDIDYRDWLLQHGAEESTITSAPIETLAAAAFTDGPYGGAGAGTYLHLTMRVFLTYRKSIVQRMAAGMGETIIAPLYRVLRERGVNFAFFHRIEGLERGERDGVPVVERILVRRQVSIVGGGEYQPLELFSGMYCWPKQPRYEQIVEADAIRGHELDSYWNTWDRDRPIEALELDRDFDLCVLGISVAALKPLCKDLIAHQPLLLPDGTPTLRATIEKLRTTETMAAQLWLKPDFADIGAVSAGIGVAYPQPFETWTEMDHLLDKESWPAGHQPNSLVYLCTALEMPPAVEVPLDPSDSGHVERQYAYVYRELESWLDRFGGQIFRQLRKPNGEFDYDQLVDRQERKGKDRLAAQYWCATNHPSDRYVLTVAGTNKFRVRPHQSGYGNLVLAGDWTLNPFSAGCVESAVASGREASRVICGLPKWIYGDWLSHVRGGPPKPLIALEAPRSAPAWNVQPLRESIIIDVPRPSFLRRPFDMTPRPPFHCKGAVTNWFFFEADKAALTRLVDDNLNAAIRDPDGPRYEPLVPLVAFVAAEIDKLWSLRDRQGWMAEKDFAFWIPVRVTRAGKPASFAWFQPALWVDSGPAATGGREAMGMNKAVARLTSDEQGFAIDTVALERYDDLDCEEPAMEAREQRLLELRAPQKAAGLASVADLDGAMKLVKSLKDWLSLRDGPRAWISHLAEQARHQEMTIVALKQFPEVDGSDDACYQKVVEYPSRVLQMYEMKPRFSGGELVIYPFESHPIAELFGLRARKGAASAGAPFVAESVFGVTMRFDFTLEAGRVVTSDSGELELGAVAESAE